jgi:hypothetical protein
MGGLLQRRPLRRQVVARSGRADSFALLALFTTSNSSNITNGLREKENLTFVHSTYTRAIYARARVRRMNEDQLFYTTTRVTKFDTFRRHEGRCREPVQADVNPSRRRGGLSL